MAGAGRAGGALVEGAVRPGGSLGGAVNTPGGEVLAYSSMQKMHIANSDKPVAASKDLMVRLVMNLLVERQA